MSLGQYTPTSATCTIAANDGVVRARLVGISPDGAEVLAEKSLPMGRPARLAIDGRPGQDLDCRILANLGDGGDGYRLQLKLVSGSWPYQLFVALSTVAHAPKPDPKTTAIPCLAELGLTMPCRVADVEKAFSLRVRKAHPDRGGNVADFVRLRAAYLEALALLGGSR